MRGSAFVTANLYRDPLEWVPPTTPRPTTRRPTASAEAAQLMRGHITHSLTATAISALEDREGIHVT